MHSLAVLRWTAPLPLAGDGGQATWDDVRRALQDSPAWEGWAADELHEGPQWSQYLYVASDHTAAEARRAVARWGATVTPAVVGSDLDIIGTPPPQQQSPAKRDRWTIPVIVAAVVVAFGWRSKRRR